MEDNKQMEQWIWLSACLEIRHETKYKLLEKFGDPEHLLALSEAEIEAFIIEESGPAYAKKVAKKVTDPLLRRKAHQYMEETTQKKIAFVSLEDEQYPSRLRTIPLAPMGLFYRGTLPSDEVCTCAIIGSRTCSYYGKTMALETAREAVKAGMDVISGLARGIDSAGHEGALFAGGRTYAVLGCGVDVIYPPEHCRLYEKILETGGGIISEYPPGASPLPYHFPQRNRIISGLSDKVLVLEAGVKSGSLITAGYALEQGKEVWALPGRVGDPMSVGTNQLLRDGALVLASPGAFTEFFNKGTLETVEKQKKYRDGQRMHLDKKQEVVYSYVDSVPKSADMICMLSDLGISETVRILSELEEKGLICQVYESYFISK